ncbi:hypothetical protein PROFUN_04254 [Planoprotostelium fungivorum]|uniref:NADH dehydrogenase [ubiquinone] iron-sulfur protein 4, mitochondrial n=1 Tax=Planoprotostelium fungivorum TaxID=1890364 RepID=A0A2P6NV27_9EUKA|nr:hypothetical protein PROFUN_04254 [Planoprotostelium fungivorum]
MQRIATSTRPLFRPRYPVRNITLGDKHSDRIVFKKDNKEFDTYAISKATGCPESVLGERVFQIYRPLASPDQSGLAKTQGWKGRFNNTRGYDTPLMGWQGNNDPVNSTILSFASKEEAIEYATKEGFKIEVKDRPDDRIQTLKNYGDNFKYRPPAKSDEDW